MTDTGLLRRMADFDLTETQRQVRAAVREFAEREILPSVEQHEREGRYPREVIARLAPLGYLAPLIPEAYGGSFIDVVTYGVVCEELARVDWVVASAVSVANSLVGSSILRSGTPEQRQRWLPPLASGAILASACLTEPSGGTDLAAMRTRATPVDGEWRLNGRKVFISHAAEAGIFLVAATIDPSRRHRGVTIFLVDPSTDGIEVSPLPMRTLQRDNLAEVRFDDVHVDHEAVLGEPGRGFPILGAALDMGRFSVAARCVGQAQRADQPDADRVVEPPADRIAEQRARDRCQRGDQRELHRLLRFGQAHQAQQGMGRDRKEGGFDEGEQRQPPHRMRMRGLVHRPVVEPAQHRFPIPSLRAAQPPPPRWRRPSSKRATPCWQSSA